jgi:hypothetical protein
MNVYGLTIVLKNKKRHSTPMCAMPRTLRMPLFDDIYIHCSFSDADDDGSVHPTVNITEKL